MSARNWVLGVCLGSFALQPRAEAAVPVPLPASAISQLVRQAVCAHFEGRPLPPPVGCEPSCGVFVTYSRHGATRACWGTLRPQQATLAQEIAQSAVKALSLDYRRPPVGRSEVQGLVAHVSLVGPLEPVFDVHALQPRRYGLFMTGAAHGSVLLPGEAATSAWQLATCRAKAGLPRGRRVRLYQFETAVVGPIALGVKPRV